MAAVRSYIGIQEGGNGKQKRVSAAAGEQLLGWHNEIPSNDNVTDRLGMAETHYSNQIAPS